MGYRNRRRMGHVIPAELSPTTCKHDIVSLFGYPAKVVEMQFEEGLTPIRILYGTTGPRTEGQPAICLSVSAETDPSTSSAVRIYPAANAGQGWPAAAANSASRGRRAPGMAMNSKQREPSKQGGFWTSIASNGFALGSLRLGGHRSAVKA